MICVKDAIKMIGAVYFPRGDPLRGHPAQGLGRQPDLGWCASAVGADVGVADLLAAGAFGLGLP
jgi:hypothetical protein